MFNQTRPPQISPKTPPLSIKGRFNRLSYLGWYGLLSISWSVSFSLSLLQFQPVSVSIMSKFMNLFYRHSLGSVQLH